MCIRDRSNIACNRLTITELNIVEYWYLYKAHRPEYSKMRVSASVYYVINCGLDTVRTAGGFQKSLVNASRVTYTTALHSGSLWNVR